MIASLLEDTKTTPNKKMKTLQINQENRRLQNIKNILQAQYAEKFQRVNKGHDECDGLIVLRAELKSVEDRIESNWNLHG